MLTDFQDFCWHTIIQLSNKWPVIQIALKRFASYLVYYSYSKWHQYFTIYRYAESHRDETVVYKKYLHSLILYWRLRLQWLGLDSRWRPTRTYVCLWLDISRQVVLLGSHGSSYNSTTLLSSTVVRYPVSGEQFSSTFYLPPVASPVQRRDTNCQHPQPYAWISPLTAGHLPP